MLMIGSVHCKCPVHPCDHTIAKLLTLEDCWYNLCHILRRIFASSSISYRCIPTTSTKTVQESIPPHFFCFQVELAFAETFQKLHEIRTDTPVLPVFLSDHNVSEDVGAVNFNELHRLGFRKVSNHKFLDL